MPRRSKRALVLQRLKDSGSGGALVDELCSSLGIHHTTVRRHLRALELEGRVEVRRLEADGLSGRPPNLYLYRK